MPVPRGSITSANSVLTLSVLGLFNSPIPIVGFAADSAFAGEAVNTADIQMSVDGLLSVAYVPKEMKVKLTLSPDSPSKTVFDTWYNTELVLREKLFANATLILPATAEVFSMQKGVLTSYPSITTGKKKLDPVEYEITFQFITKAGI